MITATLALALLSILVLLLFKVRRTRSTNTTTVVGRGFHSVGDDYGVHECTRIGTGDPPGSFHHGCNHHTVDGTQYLSTNCEDCYETWRNGLIEKDRRVGTGDPPGSFHYGNYHFTKSGTRYLSTNCEDCYETWKKGFLEDGLPTIMENEILISPDSRDLGAAHMGMDVHVCASATCKQCMHTITPSEVSFVQSAGPKNQDITIYSDYYQGERRPLPRLEESLSGESSISGSYDSANYNFSFGHDMV